MFCGSPAPHGVLRAMCHQTARDLPQTARATPLDGLGTYPRQLELHHQMGRNLPPDS